MFLQIGSDFGLVGGGTPSSFTSSPPSSTPLGLSTIEAVRSGPSLLSTEMIFSLSVVFPNKDCHLYIVISNNILLSKVFPSKEETPAHSRHPLPPIFLSPTSSRQLKVTHENGI